MNQIRLNTTIVQSSDQVSKKIEDNTVLMSIEEGKYFNLNRVASRIWEIIEEPKTIKQVIDQLLSEFEISQEDCEQDVDELVSKLSDLRLIQMN